MSNKSIKLIFFPLLIIILVGFLSCSRSQKTTTFWDEHSNPESISSLVISDLLSRQELMMYRTDFMNTLHYAEACAGLGALRLLRFFNDSTLILDIENRYRGILENFDTLPANHVDANVIGVLPLQLYRWNKKEAYLLMGIEMADIQWDNPQHDGLTNQTRYWIDDMYMIGILQIEAFELTGDIIYLDRAAMEMDSYLRKLQQPNGLFHHGPDAPFYWGRGNGWMAAALAEMIAVLPTSNVYYSTITDGYKRMMESLVEYQTPNGMWRQLIDNETAWDESSGTAMFGYAIKVGVDTGLLTDKKFIDSYQRAWLALVKHMTPEGQLTDICVGTGQSSDVQYYLDRPIITGDLHGQAPMLWFAYSLLKGYKH